MMKSYKAITGRYLKTQKEDSTYTYRNNIISSINMFYRAFYRSNKKWRNRIFKK